MSELLITDSELAGVRTDVEQIFEDEGIIERITSLGTLDHATGLYADEVRVTIYEGRCLFAPIISRRDRFDEVGQGLVFTRQYRVDIPWTVIGVQIRDRFTPTVSRDPQAIGREMTVRDVMIGSILGYRRLTVQDTRE